MAKAAAKQKALVLNPSLDGKYKIVGKPVQRFEHPRFGRIDFATLTEQQAEALAKHKDFPYLEATDTSK
tara:strand:- start:32867 stop:33073 length:207 start_codon:yes stop_codon:yes gene_type:complete